MGTVVCAACMAPYGGDNVSAEERQAPPQFAFVSETFVIKDGRIHVQTFAACDAGAS